MKLWKIHISGEGLDDYTTFIVLAVNEKQALALAQNEFDTLSQHAKHHTVTEIPINQAGVVLWE